jgi:hypothetical protein
MNDDEFLDSLKSEARLLRYEPVDPAALERIRARIAERLEPRVSAFDLLVAWARPLGASLAAAALALILGLYSFSGGGNSEVLTQSEFEQAVLQEDGLSVFQ